MLRTTQFWLLTALALAAAAVAIVNIVLFEMNRSVQAEVSARQQFIQQSIQLQGLYTEMVKALAELSVRNQDAQLGQLLGSLGISVSFTPKPSAPAPQSGESAKKGAK
jgi:uncharacterized membrane protein YidH (DUF202 family)